MMINTIMITREDKLSLIAEAIMYESEDINEIVDKVNNLIHKGMAKATVAAYDMRDKMRERGKGKPRSKLGTTLAKAGKRAIDTTMGGDKLAPPVGSIGGSKMGLAVAGATIAVDAAKHAIAQRRKAKIRELEALPNKSSSQLAKLQALKKRDFAYSKQETQLSLPKSKVSEKKVSVPTGRKRAQLGKKPFKPKMALPGTPKRVKEPA